MVLLTPLCQSVMCFLVPTVFYTRTLTAPKLRRIQPELKNNDAAFGNIKFPTLLDNVLRQLAATNTRGNTSPNGLDTDNISVMVQQSPPWILYSTRPSIKIYGEGSEYRFPPFLEFLLQRIQAFFSVYKYQDKSRPGAGSHIQDVEFIQPTKVTIEEANENKEDVESSISTSENVLVLEDDFDDGVFDDGVGVIAVRSKFFKK